MASLGAIRSGLAANLSSIAGLSVYSTAPGQVNTPAAVVLYGEPVIAWDESNDRTADRIALRIMLLAARFDDQLAQDVLDGYLAGSGASSIKSAAESDDTLGGVASWVWVSQVSQVGPVDWADIRYLGAMLEVEVMT